MRSATNCLSPSDWLLEVFLIFQQAKHEMRTIFSRVSCRTAPYSSYIGVLSDFHLRCCLYAPKGRDGLLARSWPRGRSSRFETQFHLRSVVH
ncbi:hypothetical protein AVEN_261189-1 [Araneus ventricosus]|uniref:Uncharacterized protein n=1 Tax=Araneus ventricosus TaxID=182803 RepID=A0A4Y1ZRV2_ARAVE|nr:hypothetical protein AVEN_258272-1 [Araneus ventricosus]GBL64204.1 hypothetical protein AVEN_261189-1 [Araneus ventricosus]